MQHGVYTVYIVYLFVCIILCLFVCVLRWGALVSWGSVYELTQGKQITDCLFGRSGRRATVVSLTATSHTSFKRPVDYYNTTALPPSAPGSS
jgi:hypothetical protein